MTTNKGTDSGAMPANVSDSERATVTAGLAKLVELVNQYAAVMYPPTANATASARGDLRVPSTTRTSPNVATASARRTPLPLRSRPDTSIASRSNIRLATTTPTNPPTTWAPTRAPASAVVTRPTTR